MLEKFGNDGLSLIFFMFCESTRLQIRRKIKSIGVINRKRIVRKLPLLISAEIFVAFESELVSVAFSHNFQIPKISI